MLDSLFLRSIFSRYYTINVSFKHMWHRTQGSTNMTGGLWQHQNPFKAILTLGLCFDNTLMTPWLEVKWIISVQHFSVGAGGAMFQRKRFKIDKKKIEQRPRHVNSSLKKNMNVFRKSNISEWTECLSKCNIMYISESVNIHFIHVVVSRIPSRYWLHQETRNIE